MAGGAEQLDKGMLEKLTLVLLEEALKRAYKKYGFVSRYEMELNHNTILIIPPNGKCAKCNEWPGSI